MLPSQYRIRAYMLNSGMNSFQTHVTVFVLSSILIRIRNVRVFDN